MRPGSNQKYLLIEELVDRYEFFRLADGRALVLLEIPAEFAALWLKKLNTLYASDSEIQEWRNVES
jgi:hypothetical protein